MTSRQSAKTFSNVRADVRDAYHRLGTERAVAAEIGISAGMVHKILVDNYEPKTAHIRKRLGLSITAPAPVCGKCGQVHVTKRCTVAATGPRKPRTAYKPLWLMTWAAWLAQWERSR